MMSSYAIKCDVIDEALSDSMGELEIRHSKVFIILYCLAGSLWAGTLLKLGYLSVALPNLERLDGV